MAALALGAFAGCGDTSGDTVAITKTRLGEKPTHQVRAGLSILERAFGPERIAAERAKAQGNRPGLPTTQSGQNPLAYDVPEGWQELPLSLIHI